MIDTHALKAVKDILYMYRILLTYQYLFSDMSYEDGDFDPVEFVCYMPDDELYLDEGDLKLLHEGSGIKLLCGQIQSWEQGGYPNSETYWSQAIKELVADNKLDHIPEIRDVLKTSLISIDEARNHFQHIYNTYVSEYFSNCSRGIY